MSKFYKYLYITVTLIFIVGVFFILSRKSAQAPAGEKMEVSRNSEVNNNSKKDGTIPAEENVLLEKNIPDKILISVPFTTQAPFAKWDEFHEEACEEASLVMLKYYLDKKSLTPEIAEEEIQKMIAFEIKSYGDYKDSDVSEIVKLFYDFYNPPAGGEKLRIVYDFQKRDLKKYLADGAPIIVPAAGRLLGNPNFTAPGPLYHNLVLIGYDGNTIITNDPGTRKGRGYTYNIDVLYNAVHDFSGKPEDIEMGRKAMIVIDNGI